MKKNYGCWDSPITAEMCAASVIAFEDVTLDGQDIYWTEMRPQEAGRYVIVKRDSQGTITDILPKEYSSRTRVHEMGGGSFTVHQGIIYFTNDKDQRVYVLKPGQPPTPLTPPGIRFANFVMSRYGLIAIGESHLAKGEPENFLALICLETGDQKKLASGYDFYSAPALSQDQQRLAWICWDHPNMPWDETTLWVADFTADGLQNVKQIDPHFTEQSFFQPQWDQNGELIVISDKSNWWNLYRVKNDSLEPVFSVEKDIGRPMWLFGLSQWAFYQGGILCAFSMQLFHFKDGQLSALDIPYGNFSQLRVQGDRIVCIAGSPQKPTAIICIENDQLQICRQNMTLTIDPAFLSKPKHITFDSQDNRQAHAYFYAPTNPNFQGQDQQKPPLIVKSHGGPTANCGCDLNLDIQYWTSRGFAYVDVNYAGSTGYGRAYRKSLEHHWGIYDVQDCVAAATYLVKQNEVSSQWAITGGSAGGYTTLAALTFTQAFHVGASSYGVSDLQALAKDTHKFESRYLDRLIGPYPKDQKIYDDRSPIYHTDQLSKPVIFFQGDEDQIVPPDQTEKMYQALKEKGIKTEMFIFKGEQHGFRKAENRITVLKEQLRFFKEVLQLS